MNLKHILPIVTCLSLIIILITFVTVTQRKTSEEARRQDAIASALHSVELEKLKIVRAQQEQERQELLEMNNTYTVYQRFEERALNIYILYVGDDVVYGAGVDPQTQSWRMLLRSMYKKYFNPNIIGTELTPKDESIDKFAYAKEAVEAFVNIYDLHLTYVSIGSDESYTDFAARYEEIVRAAKLPRRKDNGKDKGALSDVVCVIQHDQSYGDAEAIKRIAEYYGALCIDMRPVFEGSSTPLTTENGLPNIRGNELYADTIFARLKKTITEQKMPIACPSEPLFYSNEK